MFHEESFDTLPAIFSLHTPIESAFLYLLAENSQLSVSQNIFKNNLKRTVLLREKNMHILTFESWHDLRSYLCFFENKNEADKTYLVNYESVQRKLEELLEKINVTEFLQYCRSRAKNRFMEYIMGEQAYNLFENKGEHINREVARKEAERQLGWYVERLKSLLQL